MDADLEELLVDRFSECPHPPHAGALTPLMAKVLDRRTHRAYTDEPVGEGEET